MAKDTPAEPRPRLCHLRKWPGFSGYGFNLHAEKGKAGHFVGKVDDASPALTGGLREGDRIVEVNGTNIGNENHQQVVARIQAVPHETRILVVDHDADEFYRKNRIVVRGDLAEVETVETPLINPFPKPPDAQYKGKQCDLKVWSNFIGYGFNLHAEKGNPSHIIGKVDPRSPAEATGMTEGDRILEVNGVNVLDEPHLDVVKRIKSDSRKVSLLLVSEECEDHLRRSGLSSPWSRIVDIVHNVCPEISPFISTENNSTDSPRVHTKPHATTSPQNAKDASICSTLPESNASSVDSCTSLPSGTEADKRALRLCIMKRPETDPKCYGFTMHATKGRPGHYITDVDPGSVADGTGLRKGDDIIEVNGVNVENVSHRQVVEMIKAVPNETCLLVVSNPQDHDCCFPSPTIQAELNPSKADQSNNLQSNYVQNRNLEEDSEDNISADYRQITDEIIAVAEREAKTDQISSPPSSDMAAKATTNQKSPPLNQVSPGTADTSKSDSSPTDTLERSTESKRSPIIISGIEFAPSAEEARKRMTKKSRVKEENLSIRDKFRLFERL